MKKLNILVTAGPTQEMIDPVRFISNRSTGVMGYRIARAAKKKGHNVTLISGPVNIAPPKGIKYISIKSVKELKKAVLSNIENCDCLFMVAAVSDWRPSKIRKDKIKRGGRILNLRLEPTPDILKSAAGKKGKRVFVGFSLETKPGIALARKKLKDKNLDMLVSNRLTGYSSPFGDARIKSVILYKNGKIEKLASLDKGRIAGLLLERAEKLFK